MTETATVAAPPKPAAAPFDPNEPVEREQVWDFMTAEGHPGWRYRTREGWLFELIFLRAPFIASPLLHELDGQPN